MKVLCAGAGGYIGIPLCHQLVKEGHDVIAFDRYFFGKKPDQPTQSYGSASGGKITMVVGDTRSVGADDLRGVDAVVDLAGLSNDASCEIDPEYTNEINVSGARNLINQAILAGVPRYIYSSSASVYGNGKKHNLTEESIPQPLTDYARSKVYVERHLQGRRFSRFDYVILRNATVFGVSPRMRFDLAVNAMTARAMLERSIYVMGGGNQWRPFIHVDDVVSTIIWAINNAHVTGVAGETFNVGCQGNQMTIRTLAGRVANTFIGVKTHMIPDNPDNRSYHLSFDKLKKAWPKFRFKTIEDGIWEIRNALTQGKISFTDPTTHTLQWYRSILEWDQRLKELRYKDKLL